jgi:hypothetical protein
LQLQVGTNGYSIMSDVPGNVPAQYLDDVTVGPKLHFVDQTEHMPSIAVSAAASIPTFSVDGYTRTYDALFTGYVTKDLGPLHADLNVGLNLWRIEDPSPQVFAALAVSTTLFGPLAAMAEGYVFTSGAPIASRDGGLLLALSQTPRTWLVFDEGGDIGFYPSARSFSLFVGATFIPAVFWRKEAP